MGLPVLKGLNKTKPYLSQPTTVVENFKFKENFCEFIVVLDDLLRLSALEESVLLLEDFHWLLNTTEQLTGPGNFTC